MVDRIAEEVVVYTDIHCFSSVELWTWSSLVQLIEDDIFEGKKVVTIGDIIDLKNTAKDEVAEAAKAIKWLQKNVHACIMGNHELDITGGRAFHMGNVRFSHGDYEFWGAKQAEKSRRRNAGAPFLKRLGLSALKDLQDQNDVEVSKHFEGAMKTLSGVCRTAVMGHKHPRKVWKHELYGVQAVVLPRGRHVLSVRPGIGDVEVLESLR